MPAVVSPTAASLKQYERARFTAYTAGVCVVAAFGGALFGYDIGVTGGVTANSTFLKKFFPHVYCRAFDCAQARPEDHPNPDTDPYCKYNDHVLQLFTSSLFIAGMLSCLVAGVVTRRCGRRATMAAAAVMFVVGACLTAGAVHVAMLVVGRVSLGLGVGFANQAVPLYLSEMAPTHLRGALNIMFQLATTVGILVAQLVNLGALQMPNGWRISLAGAGVPAVVLLIGSVFLPDTPASLTSRGKPDAALAVLQKARGRDVDVSVEYEDIKAAVSETAEVEAAGRGAIWRRKYRPELVCVLAAPMFQQLTGINSIMFYAPVLFGSLGSDQQTALLNTVVVGIVFVLSTVLAVVLVDRAGRRALLISGGVVMAAAQAIMAGVLGKLFMHGSTKLPPAAAIAIIVVVCVFIAAFGWSWGPLGWLLPSEVQPLETRSTGMALTVSVNLLFTFIMGQAFLSMLCGLKWAIFLFFGVCVVVMTLYSWLLLPETKNVPIEEMGALWRAHPFWRRVVGDEGGGGKGGGGEDKLVP